MVDVMTLHEFVNSTWLPQLPTVLHARTVGNYRRAYRLHIAQTLGKRDLSEIRRADVHGLLLALSAAGRARSSVRTVWIALSNCLTLAVDLELIERNPAHGVHKRVFARKAQEAGDGWGKAPTREAVTTLLAAVYIVRPDVADLVVTLVSTGARIGEVVALTCEDVLLEQRKLRIARSFVCGEICPTKSRQTRFVDLSAQLAALLARRVRFLRSSWLFPSWREPGRPMGSHFVRDALHAVCQQAQIPYINPHCFRHFRATVLIEECGDITYVSRQLGHSGIGITADLYGANAAPRRLDVIDKLDALVPSGGSACEDNL